MNYALSDKGCSLKERSSNKKLKRFVDPNEMIKSLQKEDSDGNFIDKLASITTSFAQEVTTTDGKIFCCIEWDPEGQLLRTLVAKIIQKRANQVGLRGDLIKWTKISKNKPFKKQISVQKKKIEHKING